MDFSLTKEQKFFKEQVSRAVQRIVAPSADFIDRSDSFPGDLFRELGSLGYYGIRYPAEIGGMGADCVMFTILAEELARALRAVVEEFMTDMVYELPDREPAGKKFVITEAVVRHASSPGCRASGLCR